MHFLPLFRTFSLFAYALESKTSYLTFILFYLTKQLRYTTYSLESCYSYLGSIKHTYISMVNSFHILGSAGIWNLFFFLFA